MKSLEDASSSNVAAIKWTNFEEDEFLPNRPLEVHPGQEARNKSKAVKHAQEGPTAPNVVVFRVPHSHPHRLKRPLHHSDDLTGLHFALRPYTILDHGGDTLEVQRAGGEDILCVELFSKSGLLAENLIRELKQWTVESGMRFDGGEGQGNGE